MIEAVSNGARGDEVVVPLRGEIDLEACGTAREELHGLVDDGTRHLVLDLQDLSFMDSSALGMLVGLHRRLQALDGQLELRGPANSIRRALAVTGLDRVLVIVD